MTPHWLIYLNAHRVALGGVAWLEEVCLGYLTSILSSLVHCLLLKVRDRNSQLFLLQCLCSALMDSNPLEP